MGTQIVAKLKQAFENKKVLIVGLGLQGSGVGLVKFFSELGAVVTATDLKIEEQLATSLKTLKPYGVNFILGKHILADFLSADYIFKGPSVPWDLPELVEAEKKQIPIEMEASFFAQHCPAQIIGVTGTRGKTTVSQMLYEALKKTGKSVHLGGNVSETSTIQILNNVAENDLVVLELSSWQLSGFHRKKVSPHIAVFTNFYPDHLNFYRNEDEYFFDKTAIYAYQKAEDYLIINCQLEKKIDKEKIVSQTSYFTAADFKEKLTYLQGMHNYENAAAALAVLKLFGIKQEEASKLISSFKGARYRQEKLLEKERVTFINDSTSTTPISTIKALETFNDRRIVLILGGSSKRLPYDELLTKLNLVDFVVLLKGDFTSEIEPKLNELYPGKISVPYDNLESAVKKASEMAHSYNQETYVLFSPGATSFGMFVNEFDRARKFEKIVNQL